MYLSQGFCSMKNDKIPRCERTKVFVQMSFVIQTHFFQIRIVKHFKIALVLLNDTNDFITFSIKHLPFISLSIISQYNILYCQLDNTWKKHNK
jgi:hypothetical protein